MLSRRYRCCDKGINARTTKKRFLTMETLRKRKTTPPVAFQNEYIPGGGRYRGKSGKAGFDVLVGARVGVVVDGEPVDIE
jgi:hypothetical protein